MSFQKQLLCKLSLVPNMQFFVTSPDAKLDCLGELSKCWRSDGKIMVADESLPKRQGLFGGQFFPSTYSNEPPLTVGGLIESLPSIGGMKELAHLRPGNLIEFVQYVQQGGQVTQECLVIGDKECTGFFRFKYEQDQSRFFLSVPGVKDFPMSRYNLGPQQGIFVVGEWKM